MPKKKKKGHGLGVSLLVATAGALGAYFLYGTEEGKKKRVAVRGWALKAKGDVLNQVERMKDVSREKYDAVVASVVSKYEKLPDVDKRELKALGSDLKSAWKRVAKGATRVASRTGAKAKKKKVPKADA